jgi:secondary thiamine-phosphate synthase enzyme
LTSFLNIRPTLIPPGLTGETNGDSHLKSLLVHHEVIVPVTNGSLDLGPWQQVYYAEFDGRRKKRVIVKVMGE